MSRICSYIKMNICTDNMSLGKRNVQLHLRVKLVDIASLKQYLNNPPILQIYNKQIFLNQTQNI
jgi:hypothetical protein